MSKIIECSKVNPSGGCNHVVKGETVEEVLKQAESHAKEHGLQTTPQLMEQLKGFIQDQ